MSYKPYLQEHALEHYPFKQQGEIVYQARLNEVISLFNKIIKAQINNYGNHIIHNPSQGTVPEVTNDISSAYQVNSNIEGVIFSLKVVVQHNTILFISSCEIKDGTSNLQSNYEKFDTLYDSLFEHQQEEHLIIEDIAKISFQNTIDIIKNSVKYERVHDSIKFE